MERARLHALPRHVAILPWVNSRLESEIARVRYVVLALGFNERARRWRRKQSSARGNRFENSLDARKIFVASQALTIYAND